jgi:hypothetical protein
MMKAYRVTCTYFDPPLISITWAETARRARYINYSAAHEVGYKITFAQLQVKRAKEYDDHPEQKPNVCRDEVIVKSYYCEDNANF